MSQNGPPNPQDALARFLEENGFTDINSLNQGGENPLTLAIRNKNKAIFDILLNEENIELNAKNQLGKTPLICAALGKDYDMLVALIDKGADLSIPWKKSVPLDILLKNKAKRALSHIILKITGFSTFDLADDMQNTILHILAKIVNPENQNESKKILDFLEDNLSEENLRSIINAKNKDGDTPLILAAQSNNFVITEWLLKNKADLTIKNNFDLMFLDYAFYKNGKEKNKNIKSQWVDLLKKHNINSQWPEIVEQIKAFSHILGIGSFLKVGAMLKKGGIVEVPLNDNLEYVSIYTEGWEPKEAFLALENCVKDYHNKNLSTDKEIFKEINESLAVTNACFENKKFQGLLDLYDSGKPVFIPIGSEGHSIGVSIYKGKLIYTDRFILSGKRFTNCTKICQLNDNFKIEDLLQKSQLHEAEPSISELSNYLRSVTDDFDNPILYTGDKLQSHGTCAFSNPRSNLEGLICLMQTDQEGSDNIENYRESAKKSYRDFLYFARDEKISELIGKMKDPANQNIKTYYDLAEGFMRSHKHIHKNDRNDWNNVLRLYDAFNDEQRSQFRFRNMKLSIKINLYKKLHKPVAKDRSVQPDHASGKRSKPLSYENQNLKKESMGSVVTMDTSLNSVLETLEKNKKELQINKIVKTSQAKLKISLKSEPEVYSIHVQQTSENQVEFSINNRLDQTRKDKMIEKTCQIAVLTANQNAVIDLSRSSVSKSHLYQLLSDFKTTYGRDDIEIVGYEPKMKAKAQKRKAN